MFEKFLSADAQDFRTRYQGTYGFYKDAEGKRLLVRIKEVDGAVHFVDKNNLAFQLNADSKQDIGFEFIPPRSACYNTEIGAVYVERTASRQFVRGVSDRNTAIFYYDMAGKRKSCQVVFKYLEMVYDQRMSQKDALDRFFQGKVGSVALSNQFILTNTSVLVLGNEIGKVVIDPSTKGVVFQLDDKTLFKTEITDSIRETQVIGVFE